MEKIIVAGMGPGAEEHMTPAVTRAIREAQVIAGYGTYLDLVEHLTRGKEIINTGMRKETERVDLVLEAARQGKKVCLISSGDAGLYGMAGLLLERAGEDAGQVTVLPGISSAFSAAALLGAPLMHDTALISLSDLLTDAELIRKRVKAAAMADFVTVLYNPKSKTRVVLLKETEEIMGEYRSPETPVGLVRNCGREGEEVVLTTLKGLGEHPLVDMLTTVVIGNSTTKVMAGRMVTPRGYEKKN